MLTVKELDSYIVECLLHFTDDEISMKSVCVWVWLLAEILLLFFLLHGQSIWGLGLEF